MDLSAWISVIALALVIPLGIATNLLTPKVTGYFEKRKLIKSNRTKEQDIAAYRSVEAFKNGKRDKYASYIGMAILSVFFALAANTCIVIMVLKYQNLEQASELLNPPGIFFVLTTLLFLLFSLLFLIVIIGTSRRIEHFEEYTAEIRKKWGEDAV
jgi:hypothetical protein